jgi:hypothetical protein
MVANIINQKAIARDVNKVKPRILQIHLTVSDRSVAKPFNIRGVRPEIIETSPATEEPTNNIAQGFERSDLCDNTKIFKTFPTLPNINMNLAK